ncbi:MAG: SMP-30/gluconolactonase/LRE family protein, partial [Pseudomonadota bacterium]
EKAKEARSAAPARRGGARRGMILRFDTANPLDDTSWKDRTRGEPILFEPVGIDLFQATLRGGQVLTRLFVVNIAGPEILLFDVDANGDLSLIEKFKDPRLLSPNDIVATGPRSFYVTNDTASGRKTWRGKLDFLLGLKTGQIFHYDGTAWADVAAGLAFPNGLALSEDGQTLYLAEMRAKTITTYDRDPRTDVISSQKGVKLASFPNNLSIDQNGHLMVGMVPQPFSFTAYTEGLQEKAASQIIRIEEDETITTLFQDPGDVLSAATVGVQINNHILIGSKAANRFLMCETDQ